MVPPRCVWFVELSVAALLDNCTEYLNAQARLQFCPPNFTAPAPSRWKIRSFVAPIFFAGKHHFHMQSRMTDACIHACIVCVRYLPSLSKLVAREMPPASFSQRLQVFIVVGERVDKADALAVYIEVIKVSPSFTKRVGIGCSTPTVATTGHDKGVPCQRNSARSSRRLSDTFARCQC